MRIVPSDFTNPLVIDLLRTHVTTARAATAAGSAHALDLTGLQQPDIQCWTLWDGDALLGVGALKRLDRRHGEVKSMHTAKLARGRGVGGAMLRHIIASARADGLTRLSLETGSWPYFHPAHRFYKSHGFVESGPFGGYVLDPNSIFMTLDLTATGEPW
jgi:putative acetyltransferase